MTARHAFVNGFLIGFGIFVLVNLVAAHLLSDCGLPAVFGMDYCADDIARAGFPLVFFEEGGFAFRSIFQLPALLIDLVFGLGFAVVAGYLGRWAHGYVKK